MPTDDERRAVARRLRETGEELGSAALLWYHIAKALGVRTATDGKTACGMLAELIEPSGYGCVPGECPLNVRRDNDRIDRERLLRIDRGGLRMSVRVTIERGGVEQVYECEFAAVGVIWYTAGDKRSSIIAAGEATAYEAAMLGCQVAAKIIDPFDSMEEVRAYDY